MTGHLPGELGGALDPRVGGLGGLGHSLVAADDGQPARVVVAQQALPDEIVGAARGAREHNLQHIVRPIDRSSRLAVIKDDCSLFAGAHQVGPQQFNQLAFVIWVSQAQPWGLADEVMSINQIRHIVILAPRASAPSYAIMRARPAQRVP